MVMAVGTIAAFVAMENEGELVLIPLNMRDGSVLARGRGIELRSRTKAESDIAVGAASILAREHFLNILGNLSEECGVELPKGASSAVVDAGDAVQGAPIGKLSKGESIVNIMNAIGYDFLIPGNHEFDYGMEQFFKLN